MPSFSDSQNFCALTGTGLQRRSNLLSTGPVPAWLGLLKNIHTYVYFGEDKHSSICDVNLQAEREPADDGLDWMVWYLTVTTTTSVVYTRGGVYEFLEGQGKKK